MAQRLIRSCEQRGHSCVRAHSGSAAWKEAEDVLSYRDPTRERPTRSAVNLAVEINGSQLTAEPVSSASTLWRSATRAPAGVFLPLAGRLGGAVQAREQRTWLCFAHSSTIPP